MPLILGLTKHNQRSAKFSLFTPRCHCHRGVLTTVLYSGVNKIPIFQRNRNRILKYFSMSGAQMGSNNEKIEVEILVTHFL